jgi:serine/threonine protein kinase/WD40 repeat protein
MPVDAARAKSLFLAASDLTDAAARDVYLERECGGDAELRARVEALLWANDAAPLLAGTAAEGTGPYHPQRLPSAGEPVDSTAALGNVIAGKYKLVEVIGEGGMGCVYLAKQLEPVQRMVAVKLIRPGMDSRGVLVRFEAERQALAVMDHPNIARILDGGLHDNRPFFVMELVKGTPITKYCDERRLTPRERLELFVPVCQALQHAHQKGIIHRDIKPSNVLIALYDDRAVPKVIDFGVAKATGPSLTEASVYTAFGVIVGTPECMSPEQASLNNVDIDTRSDVYALGVLLYELLTGTTPVDRKHLGQAALLEILRIVREVEAPRPSTKLSSSEVLPTIAANRNTDPAKLRRLLKGELDWILLKALEKDRTRRYESANGFAADVQRYLAGEPVQAVPPSTGYRLKKFLKRNKGPVLATSALAALLVAGAAVSMWQAIVANQAKRDAQAAEQVADERGDAAVKAGNELRDTRDQLWSNLYAARCTLIQSAWDVNQYGRVRELLADQVPTAGQRDLRGFEWHYCDRQVNAELRSATLPRSDAYGDRISPDGTRLLQFVEGPDGNWMKSFDTTTGREMFAIREPQGVLFLMYSADGKRIVASVRPFTKVIDLSSFRLQMWDALTGEENVGVRGLVAGSLANAGPAERPLIFWQQGALKYWDGNTVKPFPGFERLRHLANHILAMSPDGRAIAARVGGTGDFPLRGPVAQAKKRLVVMDTEDGKELLKVPAPNGNAQERAVAFSPDGKRLAIAFENALMAWEIPGARQLMEVKEHAELPVFSPDGSRIAYRIGPDAKIVDAANGQVRRIIRGHDEGISSLAFSADGSVLVTAGGAHIKHWDATIDERVPSLASHQSKLPGLRNWSLVGPDAKRMALMPIIPGRAQITFWENGDKPLFETPPAKDNPRPSSNGNEPQPRFHGSGGSRFSPDGRLFVHTFHTGFDEKDKRTRWDSAFLLWDIERRRTILDISESGQALPGDQGREAFVLRCPAFSPDSRRLAALVGPPDAQVRIWDTDTGQSLLTLPVTTGNDLALAYSSDGSRLGVLANDDKFVVLHLWDAESGQPVLTARHQLGDDWKRTRETLIDPPAFSAEAGRVAFALERRGRMTSQIVRVWKPRDGRIVDLKGMSDRVAQLVFSPDGSRLAMVIGNDVVKLWDPDTGADLWTHKAPGAVKHLAFADDGQALRTVVEIGAGFENRLLDAHPRK